jgi:predicted transcriptional regulator
MAYGPGMAMLPAILEQDRRQAAWSVGQAAWRLGVTVREYRELEVGARSPSFETWDRICESRFPYWGRNRFTSG